VLSHCFVLREAHKWRVFEDMLLRRIFGLMRAEGTGDYRKCFDFFL
jgi:hypothetical protein